MLGMSALWFVPVMLVVVEMLLVWVAGVLLVVQRPDMLVWVLVPASKVGWAVLLSVLVAVLVGGLPAGLRRRWAFDAAFAMGMSMLGSSAVLMVGVWTSLVGPRWLWMSTTSLAYLCLHSLVCGALGCTLAAVGVRGARRG